METKQNNTGTHVRMQRSVTRHSINFRASVPWPGGRRYFVVLSGKERRSIGRLRREGQVSFGPVAVTYSVAVLIAAGLMTFFGSVFVFSIARLLDS